MPPYITTSWLGQGSVCSVPLRNQENLEYSQTWNYSSCKGMQWRMSEGKETRCQICWELEQAERSITRYIISFAEGVDGLLHVNHLQPAYRALKKLSSGPWPFPPRCTVCHDIYLSLVFFFLTCVNFAAATMFSSFNFHIKCHFSQNNLAIAFFT